MLTKLATSNVVLYALISAVVLFGLLAWVDLYDLITILNGVFIGTMLSITVAYGPLFWRALIGDKTVFPDARQLIVGYFGAWLAYGLVVYGSAHTHVSDLPTTPLVETAVSRYIAIISAVVQITASDYGKGVFYGRDRKVLWWAIGAGLLVGLGAIILQATMAFAFQ